MEFRGRMELCSFTPFFFVFFQPQPQVKQVMGRTDPSDVRLSPNGRGGSQEHGGGTVKKKIAGTKGPAKAKENWRKFSGFDG